jgi:hypothetical protein
MVTEPAQSEATKTQSAMTALAPVADEIAARLGETEDGPIRQIRRATRILGEERVRALVARTFDVEAAGGLMLPNESRRRTPGGVFFHLMRANIEHKEWYRIFRPQTTGYDKGTSGTGKAPATGAAPFDWTTFGVAATKAMSSAGEATTVKLTVIGRPGKIVERGDVALVAMRSEKAPSLPKGVPAPPSPQTDYMVLVGMKQWRKVAEALAADPADKLLIEGYPTVQPEFAGITVYATSATTTGIQAGKRAAQTAMTS